MRKLSELGTVRHIAFGDSEDDRSIFAIESCTEELTHEWSYLFRREIHDSDDLFPDEFVPRIVRHDLSTRLFYSDLRTEIHPDLVGGPPRFWEVLDADDCPNSELDGFEV